MFRLCRDQRWKLHVSASDGGSRWFKESIAPIVGEGAYSKTEFESGGHRVQKSNATEFTEYLPRLVLFAVCRNGTEVDDIIYHKGDFVLNNFSRRKARGGQQ